MTKAAVQKKCGDSKLAAWRARLSSGHRQEHRKSCLGGLKPARGFSLVREVRMGETFIALQEPRGNPKPASLPFLSIRSLSVLVWMSSIPPAPALFIHWVRWTSLRHFLHYSSGQCGQTSRQACSNSKKRFPNRIPAHSPDCHSHEGDARARGHCALVCEKSSRLFNSGEEADLP